MALQDSDLFDDDEEPGRRRWRWWVIALIVVGVGAVLGGGGAAGAIWYFSQDLPPLDLLQSYQPSLVTRVYSDDRQVIGQFFIERRLLTPIAQIPKSLTNAVVAVEDARFFEHPGLDVIGILRAAWTNLRHGGKKVEGASTITQQLARSLFLSSERTFDRKLRELILAYKMEVILTKEQILEMYLNQIYFGQGAYGVAAAAQSYFGKELAELTVAESAFLAGLPKSPSNFSPFKAPERARKRQEHVLDRMQDAGFITAEEHQQALAEPMNFRKPGVEHVAPYFVEHVRQLLVAKYGESMVYKGGLEVFTTLNLSMQRAAELAMETGLRELDKRQGWRGPLRTVDVATLAAPPPSAAATTFTEGQTLEGVVTKIQKDHVLVQLGSMTGKMAFEDFAWARRRLKGPDPANDFSIVQNPKQLLKPGDVIEVAVKKVDRDTVHLRLDQTPVVEGGFIAFDPQTGKIFAMVGGYDFARSEFNRATQAHRQPGSAFKPIIYATAMNQGMSPASVVLDAPVVYEQEEEDKVWKPENYGRKFHGAVSLREALAHSYNLATVRLLDQVGVRNVIDFAHVVGITSPLAADLSLGLGSTAVGLTELTSVYALFLNKGVRVEPYAIEAVQDNNGRQLERATINPLQVISKETAYLITNMMEDVIQRGTGQLAKSIDRPVAGKTGTTNDFVNAWFIGGTPNLVAGTYVGFDDRRSLGETESGAHAALPIWLAFMKEALKSLPVMAFEIPEGITFVKVDPNTSLQASDSEEQGGVVELFAKGSEPTQAATPRVDPTDFYKLDQIPESQP
jgi:penicillin-binding protein 1A